MELNLEGRCKNDECSETDCCQPLTCKSFKNVMLKNKQRIRSTPTASPIKIEDNDFTCGGLNLYQDSIPVPSKAPKGSIINYRSLLDNYLINSTPIEKNQYKTIINHINKE